MSDTPPSFETATFIRFRTGSSRNTQQLLAALRSRWNPEPQVIVDPGDRGWRALRSAADGHWLSPDQVSSLMAYLLLRRSHYDQLVHDLSLPGWARREWRDAVLEHDDAVKHLREIVAAADGVTV